jgi:UDP-N-acetylglucosamine transferase subunit ALG13
MATTGATTAAIVAAMHTSSYRVKFRKKEFLELVEKAKPELIYQTGRMHFFAFDGFVMYTFECKDSDFKQKVLHAIEFSNQAWSE